MWCLLAAAAAPLRLCALRPIFFEGKKLSRSFLEGFVTTRQKSESAMSEEHRSQDRDVQPRRVLLFSSSDDDDDEEEEAPDRGTSVNKSGALDGPSNSSHSKPAPSEDDKIDAERLSHMPDMAFRALFDRGELDCGMCPRRIVTNFAMYINGAPEKQLPGTVRFVCISDTHGKHRRIPHMPAGDVLLHAGDITNVGQLEQLKDFDEWLKELPYKKKVVIAGNHDVTMDKAHYSQQVNQQRWHGSRPEGPYDIEECRAALKHCIYLEDSSVEVEGYTIYGSPWQPEFFDWGFNLERGSACRKVWSKIPKEGVDILMTHGPPLGFGDACKAGNRVGCVDLLHAIRSLAKPPSYHVFGHIHEAFGAFTGLFRL